MHELAHARAALGAASCHDVAITLRTAPGAVRYAGVPYFRAMFDQARAAQPDAPCRIVLDCGDDPPLAHNALTLGFQHIAFSGSKAMRAKLADIAAGLGAGIVAAQTPDDALDLVRSRDVAADCDGYLMRFRR